MLLGAEENLVDTSQVECANKGKTDQKKKKNQLQGKVIIIVMNAKFTLTFHERGQQSDIREAEKMNSLE